MPRNPSHANLRGRAVGVGLAYATMNVTETSPNRGPVVDRMLRMANMRLNAIEDLRQWCGAFVYSCYLEAVMGSPVAQQITIDERNPHQHDAVFRKYGALLPFGPEHCKSGQRVRDFARHNPPFAIVVPPRTSEQLDFGDVFTIGGADSNYHVGMIVRRISGTNVQTVEGNSPRPGAPRGTVRLHTRQVSEITYAFGF